MTEICFMMLRHVNSEKSSVYWMECYDNVRKYYPENPIIIIDDNSNYELIRPKDLYKTTIIQSEYPKRGELLPYYYYLHNKWSDIAVIIHDSVYVNKYIDFNVEKYKFIWEFDHKHDQIEDETNMIRSFKDSELLEFYQNKSLWIGCFGAMSVIRHDYLVFINNKYDISNLLNFVLNRYNRMSFERVLAVLLQKHEKSEKTETILGNIHKYCRWGVRHDEIDKMKHLPLIKFWSSR